VGIIFSTRQKLSGPFTYIYKDFHPDESMDLFFYYSSCKFLALGSTLAEYVNKYSRELKIQEK